MLITWCICWMDSCACSGSNLYRWCSFSLQQIGSAFLSFPFLTHCTPDSSLVIFMQFILYKGYLIWRQIITWIWKLKKLKLWINYAENSYSVPSFFSLHFHNTLKCTGQFSTRCGCGISVHGSWRTMCQSANKLDFLNTHFVVLNWIPSITGPCESSSR